MDSMILRAGGWVQILVIWRAADLRRAARSALSRARRRQCKRRRVEYTRRLLASDRDVDCATASPKSVATRETYPADLLLPANHGQAEVRARRRVAGNGRKAVGRDADPVEGRGAMIVVCTPGQRSRRYRRGYAVLQQQTSHAFPLRRKLSARATPPNWSSRRRSPGYNPRSGRTPTRSQSRLRGRH